MLDHDSVRVVRNYIQRTSDRINDRYGGIIDRIRRIFVVELTIRVFREMSEDDLTHMAAGVAYYALFSLFPLVIGMITVFSYFLEPEQIQANISGAIGGFLPGSEQFVQDNIEGILNIRSALGLFSFLGLLWSGSAMMGALDRAINRAWDIHNDRPFYIGKPRHILMVISVGIMFPISMSSAAVVRTAQELPNLNFPVVGFVIDNMGYIILQGMSFFLMLMIFLMMYKMVPNTKTYWRYVWPGALVAAILFETSKNFFILYLEQFASYQNVYGSVAPVIVLLFWAYVSSFIVLMGAELCSEYERLKHNVERGTVRHDSQNPDAAAVQNAPVRAETEDAAR
ncbi:MAG: YihY/virulence factor BrkB family protein [Dehalococcoidia bacterium]|nr:YihY/virulence factor BrkB family protein [Dehalococcoidia bacterium]